MPATPPAPPAQPAAHAPTCAAPHGGGGGETRHGGAPGPRRRAALAWLGALPALAAAEGGRVWRVGPGEPIGRIAEAIARAGDGDTIAVLPGTYRGDVAVIQQRRLRIVGLGSGAQRPLLLADGRHAEGKAIWVVRDGDIRIEQLAFDGCRVPSRNGAAIRFERGRLLLRGCLVRNQQMGLLTSNDPDAELDIADCTFTDAPDNPGSLPHLLYVGRIARLRLHGSHFSHGRVGHLLKCRAREAEIVGNTLDDGPGGQASYEIDLPNGGLVSVRGNTVVQGPLTENAVMLSYGAEGAPWPDSRLLLEDNRFVNRRPAGGSFVRVWDERLPPDVAVLSRHNQWRGPGHLVLGSNGRAEGDRHAATPD